MKYVAITGMLLGSAFFRVVTCSSLAILLPSSSVFAQQKVGSISGIILGPDSLPIVHAKISIVGRDSNPSPVNNLSHVSIDSKGRFIIPEIPVGEYDVHVSPTDPWLKGLVKSVTVRDRKTASVKFRLRLDEACEVKGPDTVTSADKVEIVNALLQEFLGSRSLVSESTIIVSTKNIGSLPVSHPTIKFALMSSSEIQARANRLGDFNYLKFEEFEVRGSCVAVGLAIETADGTSTIETGKLGTMRGERYSYVFRKTSGKWVAVVRSGTIS